MKTDYTFELSEQFLTKGEQEVFRIFLDDHRLDERIWPVFDNMFRSAIRGSKPLMLRVRDNAGLAGAAVIIRCTRYGKALFNNRLMTGAADLAGVPFHLWIRFGCCMDMMSNPGFVRDPQRASEMTAAIAAYLKQHCFLTFICDYSASAGLYPGASRLPALPHALIDTTGMSSVEDYLGLHGNIRRKMNKFRNKGGSFEVQRRTLSEDDLASLRKCFISTSRNSVFYLPYQDLYLNSALNSSRSDQAGVWYFIARRNGEFVGYQAAIKTGSHLNALHGAFDRDRKTTWHAYDILFVKMTEFAIENGLESIDFGAVINQTKQKMVNKTLEMSYFLLSKSPLIHQLFSRFMKLTKIQGKEQMQYLGVERGQ